MSMYTNFTRRPTTTRALGLIIALFLFATLSCSAQSPAYKDWQVFSTVEQPPEFPGGRQALYGYLESNVKMPPEAVNAKVIDQVLVSFIVEPDSSISDIQILKGVGYGCDK